MYLKQVPHLSMLPYSVSSLDLTILLHLLIKGCGSKTYGGFNDSTCQPCPLNSVSGGGFLVTSCECVAGYTGQNGQPCTGILHIVFMKPNVILFFLACTAGTFKPTIGNATCQPCPETVSSEVGSSFCSCTSGYELTGVMCTGLAINKTALVHAIIF